VSEIPVVGWGNAAAEKISTAPHAHVTGVFHQIIDQISVIAVKVSRMTAFRNRASNATSGRQARHFRMANQG
jgi:hypothetical protein